MADNDDIYKGKTLLTEMYKLERTEPHAPRAEGAFQHTGVEVLAADHDEQIGLAVECAFEKFVEKGPRVTELWGGLFCIARAPKFYV